MQLFRCAAELGASYHAQRKPTYLAFLTLFRANVERFGSIWKSRETSLPVVKVVHRELEPSGTWAWRSDRDRAGALYCASPSEGDLCLTIKIRESNAP